MIKKSRIVLALSAVLFTAGLAPAAFAVDAMQGAMHKDMKKHKDGMMKGDAMHKTNAMKGGAMKSDPMPSGEKTDTPAQ